MNSTTNRLSSSDVIALGLMTFAFFLGAGNIIFPPLSGWLAGDHLMSAMLGFLLTAVGLPLSGLIAMALAGKGWNGITRDIPPWLATLMAVLIFVILGPTFAAPRAGLVAWEMGVKPFVSEPSHLHLALFSCLFFGLGFLVSLSRGKLIDAIGKWLTPLLFLGLMALAVAVILNPFSPIDAAQGIYIERAFTTGFLQGYNTMDTLAALMFGMLLIDVMKKKGVHAESNQCRYLMIAGFIAASGLALVYVSLFYLGATSSGLLANAANSSSVNGGEILVAYVFHLFGVTGLGLLSAIILLACFTTVIGLISACADYFSSLTRVGYKVWLALLYAVCALVANIGLSQLITLSTPVLFTLYPLTICLIVLTFVRPALPNPPLAYRWVLVVALMFSLVDAAHASGMNTAQFHFLPLYEYDLAWLLPSFVALMLAMAMPKIEQRST